MSPDQVTVLVRDRATGSLWEEKLTTDSNLDEMNGEDGDEYDSDEEEEQEDEEPDVTDDKGQLDREKFNAHMEAEKKLLEMKFAEMVRDLKNKVEDLTKRKRAVVVRQPRRVSDLPQEQRMNGSLLQSVANYLRGKLFKGLKIVNSEVLKDGAVVRRMCDYLGMSAEDQKKFKRHLELLVVERTTQYRNNSVRNLKIRFKAKGGVDPGKLLTSCVNR